MKKHLQLVCGMLIGILLLWFLFKDTHWPAVWEAWKNAHVWWLLLCLLTVLSSFVIRVWRWKYIVNPVVRIPFVRLFSATQIGFLGNFVLPARIGELVRALVLSRSQGIPLPKTMAFVAVDRFTDLFGLIVVFVITLAVFHPSHDIYLPQDLHNLYAGPISQGMIRGAVISMTLLLLFGAVCVMALLLQKDLILSLNDKIMGRISAPLAHWTRRMFAHFAEGMQVMISWRDLAKASAVSMLLWASFALAHYCGYKAFGLETPWYTPFVILSLLSVFISIPGPPGFIGPFHAGIVGGLILVNPSIDLDTARAIAIFGHLFNLLPVVAVGVACLSFERLRLLDLSREGGAMEEDAHQP